MIEKEFEVTCVVAFDYLTAGDTYIVEEGGKSYHCWNTKRQSGTFVAKWLFEQAIKKGYLV